MAKAKMQWLKKYTKLEYLQSILEERRLYLGNPKDWPDKNDSKLIQLYSGASGAFEMRATCLAEAADRFHFCATSLGQIPVRSACKNLADKTENPFVVADRRQSCREKDS